MKRKKIIALLQEVIRTAKMESCSLRLAGHTSVDDETDTANIREATRLWRESWIIPQLKEALELVAQ